MAGRHTPPLDVDLRPAENNRCHRSGQMERRRLVVRRGQPFCICVQGADPPPPQPQLQLLLADSRGQQVQVRRGPGSGGGWWFHQQGAQGELLLTLHSPPDAAVGRYGLQLTGPAGQPLTSRLSLHLLFNPWCKDDAVYLPDERLLQEYVLNEDGVIFVGSWDSISSIPWNYGQFEPSVMDICFEVLDNSRAGLQTPELDLGLRWDPVYVSRTIAAMVNANGGRGVLAGRWAPPYSDGTAPGSWTGSVPILQSWSRAGHTAVRYGQCWVFAAVGCTVLRCLGVPTRLVTNFSSAHDVDGNLAVDVLEDFERPGRRDSRWNFHCWLEVWMRRDDLPTGNDGWQVLDPTPQERSDGEFCCGPCPVAALREGDLGLRYDAAFVFAEVNADIVYWTLRDGRRQKIRVEQSAVGRNISTKSPHSDSREDLTLLYKYPEGSEKEREVYRRAGRRLDGAPGESRAPGAPGESRAPGGPGESADPGGLQLSVKHNSPLFGTDFDVMVQVLNEGGEDARLQLTLLATAVTHSCVHQGELHRQRLTLSVPAHGAHRQALRLYYQDYGRCAGEHHLIRVKALLEAGGGAEPVMAVSDIPLKRPELLVQVPGKAFVRQQATAYISFSNPLPEPLRGGRFTAEGAGLLSATQIHVDGDVSPGQRLAVRLAFAPSRAGVRRLLVDFDSDRLRDVKGVATVVVRKSSAAPPAVVGGHVS